MKNTMKKFLSSVLAVIILLGIVPITDSGVEASAATEYTEGYYTYTVENDEATITDVDTSISGDVTIPSSLGGYPVTALRYNAFDSCMKVTSITIPEPLTNLTGESFFAGVLSENIFVDENNPVFTSDNGVLFNSDKTKLVAYPAGRKDLSYTIPETVDTIGAYAFSATLYLETVNIPDSVKNIEYAAFAYSQRLKEVTLPESVEFMDYGVFWMCKRLEKLSLPKNLTYLHDETFQFCYSLREVILPEDITQLEGFNALPMLKKITVPEKVKEVHWIDECFSLEKIVLPESVQLLSDVTAPFLKDLYVYNSELQFDGVDLKTISNITKDELVKAHNDAAFAEIYIEDIIAGADEEELQQIDDELNRIYMELLKSAEYAVSDELTIHGYPGSTAEAYAKENGIKFEELNDTLIEGQCGDNAYYSFDTESGVLTISGEGEMWDYSYACDTPWFENGLAPYIKSAVVEEGITALSGGTFWQCYRMENVTLPESLKKLGKAAFAQCASLKEINLPENLEEIEDSCFGACYNLKEITIPNRIKNLPNDCFGDCIKLETINLPDGLETIGSGTFKGCYGLSEFTLGKNVTDVGTDAFRICPILEDIYILNPDLDFDKNDTYIGKWYILVNGYDRVEFFKKYSEVYSELMIYIADHNLGVKDIESLTGTEKERFEALNNEFNELQSKMETLADGMDTSKYVISTLLTIHGYADSTAESYANANGIKFEIIKDEVNEAVTVTDENTGVTAEYTSDIFEGTPQMIISENGKNANIIFNSKFSKYTSYDISFELNGEKVQPNGKVTIKVPLPEGYNADTTVVYYVDDNGISSKLDSSHENGYIVFETDHFSEYVLVDESSKIDEPTTEPDEPTIEPDEPQKPENDNCSCNCHKTGFMGFIWKIIVFFQKLFKINPVCDCGINHY